MENMLKMVFTTSLFCTPNLVFHEWVIFDNFLVTFLDKKFFLW